LFIRKEAAMRVAKLFPPVALILLLAVAPLVLAKDQPAPAQGRITVGEFALKVIKLAGGNEAVTQSLTAEQAVARLQQAGLHLQGAPGDPLTDADRSAFFLSVANGLMDRISAPPQGFDACAALPKVPDCLACCMALPGSSNKQCGQACGRAHADLNHVSPSEPIP
jgi:hypothetical protein